MLPSPSMPPRPSRPPSLFKPKRIRSQAKPSRLSTSKNSEHSHQAAFFSALSRINHPAAKTTFAIPNGFLRSKAMRLRAWKEGVRSGVSDVLTPYPSRGYHGLWLELKIKPNEPTPEQLTWLQAMRVAGYAAFVVWSWMEMLETWAEYLEIDVKVS